MAKSPITQVALRERISQINLEEVTRSHPAPARAASEDRETSPIIGFLLGLVVVAAVGTGVIMLLASLLGR